MAGVFSEKSDSELDPLSDEQMHQHFKVGKYDGELYWKGKKIKRGGFTLTDTIVIGLFTGSVLFFANLHNIRNNVCDNWGFWCSTPSIEDSTIPGSPPGVKPTSPQTNLPNDNSQK